MDFLMGFTLSSLCKMAMAAQCWRGHSRGCHARCGGDVGSSGGSLRRIVRRLARTKAVGWAVRQRTRLLAQSELLDERAIAVGIARPQVIEQLAATRHHPQQPASRMMVLHIGLEVIVEAVDARG